MSHSFHDLYLYNQDLDKNRPIFFYRKFQLSSFLQQQQTIKLKMKIQIILLFSVVSLINCQQSSLKCHYSCASCVGQSYTLCSKCNEDKNITTVEDPKISQTQYINSNQISGVCIGEVQPGANALGIIILIICTGIAVAIRTPFSIYLISTIQTLSLISFVEISWVTPVGYLLQSMQYFMIFNWLGSGYKIQDQTMRQRQYYRLDVYFHESTFLKNFAIVGIFNLLLIVAIVVLAIWKYKKQKQSKALKLHEQDYQQKKSHLFTESSVVESQNPVADKKQPSIKQKILLIALRVCVTAFYLMIQQSSLAILVGLRFENPISIITKAISIIYCLCLLCFLIYIFVQKLWFFPNKQTQYVNAWKKIALPVFTIVPYNITYLIVIFLVIFLIAQSFFDYQAGGYKLLSRISLYKLVQFFVIILAGAYIITELSVNIQIQTNIIRVFLAIAILTFFILIFIQLFFGIIETYCTNKNQIKNQNAEIQSKKSKRLIFNTEQTINEMNCANDQQHPNKMNIVIEDIENQDNDYYNNDRFNKSIDRTQQSEQYKRKKQEEETARKNKEQQARLKRQQEELDKKKKQQQKRQRQQEQRRRNQELERIRRQQEQRKRKQQDEKRRNQQQKRRKQQQQKQRKEEEQRRKRQQQQRKKREQQQQLERKRKKKEQEQQRKREEEQAKKRKEQEQARRRKQQQQKRRRQFEQEQARRRKKQQQQEQQAKERRKRKYMSQMDPELRKRYGL